jgi:predicted ester cyclase
MPHSAIKPTSSCSQPLQLLATHRGEFMGIPPTGKSFTVNNADTCKFTNEGLICEHWGVFDVAAMMRQLGVGS